MRENESVKWLYDNLTEEGYNVGKDYAEFDSLIVNNDESRKWVYDTATSLGYNVGKDYNEFSSLVLPAQQPKGGENGYTLTGEELGLKEEAVEEPKKEEPKKEDPKKTAPNRVYSLRNIGSGLPLVKSTDFSAMVNQGATTDAAFKRMEQNKEFNLTDEDRERMAQHLQEKTNSLMSNAQNASPNLDYGSYAESPNVEGEGLEVSAEELEKAQQKTNQQMVEGMTTEAAINRYMDAGRENPGLVLAEGVVGGLLGEYSKERASRKQQVEKDVERNADVTRVAANPYSYSVDPYNQAAFKSGATKLRNADDLKMMEEFAADAKNRLLTDEALRNEAQADAELLGMSLDDYINKIAVPVLQQRMYEEWLAPQEEKAKGYYNGVIAAAEGSLIGMLLGSTRTETEKYLSQVGQEAWRQDASLLDRALSGAGSMFLDLPIFGGFGSLASVPTKYVGGQVFKHLAKNEAKKVIARGASEAAAQRYANYAVTNGLKNRILLNLSTSPLQSGLTFGMFDAGKAALSMSLNGEWDWSELGKSAGGGFLLGAALGGTNAVGGGVTAGLTGGVKTAAKIAEFGVENAVFTEGGRLIGKLHGQQPENGWWEDYLESGATLLMLKAPNIVKNVSAIKGDKEASEVFAFNELEREQLGKYGEDLNAVLESLLPQSKRVFEDGLKISEGTFTEEYRRVMSDPEVSMTTKAKLMGIVEGKVMPAPRVVDAQVEGNRVMTYDPMGRLVEVKEYATEAKANAEYKKVANAAEIESIAVLEDVYMRIKGYEADELTVKEWLAKNPKVTMERVAEIVAKNSAGEKLTDAEQKILESLRQARREGLNDVRHLNDVLAGLDVDAKDVMSGLDKPIDKRTERENRAVRAYTDVLFREVKDKIQEPYRRGEAQRAADDVWRAANNVKWANEDVKLLADRIYESDRQIDDTANDGMIYTTTNNKGEKIIITGGKVVLDNEGYIDVNQSEGLVALMPDGTKKPVRVDELREKVEVANAEEIKAVKREEIANELADVIETENEWWESLPTDNGEVKTESGKPMTEPMADASQNGKLVPGAEIEIAFDGEVYKLKVEGRDERGDIILSGEGASMAVPESAVLEGMKEAERFRNGEVKGENQIEVAPVATTATTEMQTAPVTQAETVQPQVVAPKVAEVTDFFRMDGKNYAVVSRNEDGSVTVDVDGKRAVLPAETNFTAAVPTDKGGKVLFTEMPAEKTLEYFVQRVPNSQARAQMIENNRKQAESALKKYDKEPNVGTDPDAYEATMNKWEADKKAAQAKVDYWNEVAKRDAEISQSEMRESVEAVKPREVIEMTPDEFVANQLGGIKITPESFQKETGTKAEQKQMVGVIAGKEKGGVSIERAAEIIYESYGDELRGLGFNGDMQDVRDMIIDVLSNGNPRSFARKGLEMRQQTDVEQQLAELRGVANALNFESIEEQIAYEESIMPRIMQELKGFDETEYFNNLAENYENDTTRESENTRGSSELLQSKQSADNAGVADLAEPGQGGEVQGDVYSGGENAAPQGNQQVSSPEIPNSSTGETTIPVEANAEGGNAPGQSGVEEIQEPRSVEETLENGDKRITNYNSRGEVATVVTERDGKVVSVDSYDEGVLFEHTEYDGNGKAASVTRYDKNGNAIGTQKYVDGKAKASHPVADKVLERANEAAILKKLIETNTSAAELQQGVLELDRENPAFERATENVRKKLEATGVKVKVLTKEEAESELARIENAQRQVVNSRMSKLDKVSRAIMNWLKNNTRNRRFEIELPAATQRKIRKEMGRDFNTHSITANSVAHSKKNHGVGGEKNTTTSIPLRDEDFALIPYIMTAPDNVIRGSYSTDGSESVRFYKNLSNGYVVVVEKEQKNSPDDMETITMWAELSANVPNARNMRPSSTTSVTVTISPDDVAKIRKDAENAILSDTKVEKMVYGGANSNQEVFVSNARKAVEEIKQEKATPQQWLAMIKKNGGLKAGEDAWMGFSEWLENNESKSLTKQEVLNFVNENAIKIEEVRYSQFGSGMMNEASKKLEAETKEIGWDAMQEKYPGIEDFFEYYNGEVLWSESTVSEGEYEDFILDNKIVDANPADNAINERRESYTTEGLERKREIALVVPTIEPYNQSDEIHFGDAGDGRAIAWVRFGETTDSEGNRVLVIDEIQSKRHQDGREKGYKNPNAEAELEKVEDAYREAIKAEKAYNAELKEKYGYDSFEGSLFQRTEQFVNSLTEEEKAKREELKAKKNELAADYYALLNGTEGVPAAPFEKNWHELAMKRMLRLAAEEGFDKVAWTTGEQQAERYNLGAVLKGLQAYKTSANEYYVIPYNNGVIGEFVKEYTEQELADTFGKELAQKIITNAENATEENPYEIEDEELRVGGEGMKGFYDKMLPSFVSKYTKRWGAKVGTVEMPSLEQNNVMHSVDVTPEMKESVMEGQTMFLRTPDGVTYGWAVNGEIYLTPEGLNPNTPIHEYTHLWAAALQKSNPKLWSEVVEAMKLSPAWNEVMADENYTDIHSDDNRVASEVLSRLSGNEGYRRYMEQAEAEIAAERNIVGKVQKKGILNRIKNAVSRFWNWLKGKLGSKAKAGDGTEAKAEPWDVFVNKSLKDFDEGMNPDAKDSPLDWMFIGKKGAENLDKAEEATTRLDNLGVAREMETAGKDAKAIKLATGWERGADGKWRYETEDVKLNRAAELFSLENHESYPIAESLDKGRVDFNGTIKLADLVNDEELFKAYPGMEKYFVSFEEMSANVKGEHDAENTMIRINKDDISELESTLVHEIQHAIQSAEGFAMGGSTSSSNGLIQEVLKTLHVDSNYPPSLSEVISAVENGYITRSQHEELVKIAQSHGYDDAVEYVRSLSPYSYYRRLAGEVESRNVEERMNYTEEQRRNSLAEETEDVRREDQIFLEKNLGVSASEVAEQDIPVESVQTQPMTFAEKITNSVLEASAKNKENLALRSDALRMYGRDVANVLKLMGKQREYDKSTVDQLVKLAKMYFKDAQLLGGLTPYQVGRVMTRLNSAVGKRDITDDANELVNILVDAHNKELDKMLEKQAKTKAKKVNASGVEVIGKLDKEGQLLLEEYNNSKVLDLETIDEKILDLQNEAADASGNVEGESGEQDVERTREVAARIRGLELARQYREEILAKQTEIKGLEQELKTAEQDAKEGAMDRAAYKEFRRATERAILESKLEMVDVYHGLIHGLGGDISSSAKRAKVFQQQQIDHVKEIQHNANSDLLGHPAEAQGETPDKWNSSVPRLFMSAMPTFQTMLKFFGEKAADGRGYLYERFIPQHTQASHNEYIGKTEAREKMRKKLTEIFGKKTSIEKFMDMSRKDGAVLEYQEGGQKKTIDLTKGQVLYLYMINKMADGQMKLSRMGITDADVQKMANELPEEFVRFADWVQEDFLTELRDKYNAVHERMFGAPMAAIESYFPIKINKRSRGEKIEPGMNAEDKPSTVTGSVIKRTKNAVAIDLSADAMQVLLGHIDDMENWAAWAEFRRDVKSLLNYRHFQNQVKGMESLRFGSGEKLWKNFVDVANIAAGSFKPSSTAADRAVRNIAKGVVSSKIAFRYFTALKQILSTPAFWSEVDFGKMMNAYLHQKKAWDWAMKNLPGFSKRWEGRASGNEILLESDADWKVWQNRAVQWLSKEGMRANAFIDALTVATGAKAVFETKYKMFKKAGYSEERAREKALNRAAEAYNESQQSSESAYLSPLQAEATFVSSVLTAYRNSPFGYNRKMATAIANLKKKMKKGFKQESIDFMIKQLMRDGLNEEQAKKFAKSVYRRSVARDAADFALYEFFLNYVWVLGQSLIYIIGGDDDEKKKELNVEALIDGAMGGLGNLPAGETLTGAIKAIAEGDVSNFKLPQAVAMQDMETIADLMQTDPVRAAGEVLNILVAMGVGVNPQTFTDMFVALADTEEWSDPREIAMLVLRLINAPNSKLELLEADEAMENYGANMEEVMKEYAEYQKSKRAPLTGWMYSDESEQKAIERYEKRFKRYLDERLKSIVENTAEYDAWYDNSDVLIKDKLAKLRKAYLEGDKNVTFEKLEAEELVKKVLYGSGYDEVNTVYYGLSTAEDEDMSLMIDQKLKDLKPIDNEYKRLTGDEKKEYAKRNSNELRLYDKLNGYKNDVDKCKRDMKKRPDKAQERMDLIRKLRTRAIDLINNYNE